MPRPLRDRCVEDLPGVEVFKPAGIPARELKSLALTLDEFESLRLADYEGLYQEAAARRMGVSRQTFGRIIESARRKVADALVNGKALRLGGGAAVVGASKGETMKIAVPTAGDQVDSHFGHCDHYTVFTADGKSIGGQETVAGTGQCGCKSGIASELARKGVTVLVAGNIGDGAVRVLSAAGISVVRGASGSVRAAAEAYLEGRLTDTGANCAAHHGAAGGALGHDCSHHHE